MPEPDAPGDSGAAGANLRAEGAVVAYSVWGGVRGRGAEHGLGLVHRAASASALGRGPDGQEEDVRFARQGHAGTGLLSGAGGGGAGAGGRLVLLERVRDAVRTVLLVAAEPGELRGILRRCTRVRRLDWPLVVRGSGELNGQRVLLVAHGPGGNWLPRPSTQHCSESDRMRWLVWGSRRAGMRVWRSRGVRGYAGRGRARPMRRSSRIPGGRSVRAH